MEQKNYTEVFIDGTVFTLGGTEDEAYLRQVAAYLREDWRSPQAGWFFQTESGISESDHSAQSF